MYKLNRYINQKAVIYDDVEDVTVKFEFNSFEEAQQYVVEKNKQILKQELASYRYAKEVEGINFGGVKISTHREAMAQFNGAYSAMKEGLTDSITWKGNGTWVEIDEPLAKEIASMAVMHVQKCFKCEKSLSDNIDDLNTIQEVENYNVQMEWDGRFNSL